MRETMSFWAFTVKRLKREELKTERAEDLIKANLIKEILKAISVAKKSRGAKDS